MRPSLRFLLVAVVGWAGVRAAAVGSLPGAEIFRVEQSEAKAAPPIAQTEFPEIEPIAPAPAMDPAQLGAMPTAAGAMPPPTAASYAPGNASPMRVQRIAVPVYYSAPQAEPLPLPARQSRYTAIMPEPAPLFYPSLPALDNSPLSRIAATSLPVIRSAVVTPGQSLPVAVRKASTFDRVQLSAWALLRSQQQGVVSSRSLANAGQLGASQAGARLSYNIDRQIAATMRTTTEVGRRGGEVALGLRGQPVRGIPVWITAERRQRLGRYGGGRNAFAIFAEAGVWNRPMPWRFSLDAYLQAGVVGFRKRDRFIDGAFTLTRPVYKQFSAGMGVWGAAQPGLYRVDAGPRVTMKVRDNLKVHVDWRQQLAGNARPGSGAAITLAGDF
jgi:hypothetical protein